MRIAVTGLRGQLVLSLLERGPLRGHHVVAVGRPQLDLAAPANATSVLRDSAPDVIVSAAAYTAVDKAEEEPAVADAVNGAGAGAVAQAAAALGVPLIHVSTDYVFDGTKAAPYTETDPAAPLGAYGRSKLAGEQAVQACHAANSAILRTAWVFSPFGNNFARTMLRLAAERPLVRVVNDQFGSPTSALDIADGVLTVAENLVQSADARLRGVFHMTSAGDTNWAGFARAIFAASVARGGPGAEVEPIPASDYPTPARRPANSRLDCGLLAETHGVRLPAWGEATEAVVARLVA